jgi:hypothetical protein
MPDGKSVMTYPTIGVNGQKSSKCRAMSRTKVAISERRQLRFGTIDDLLKEIDRIIAAEKAGTLHRTGNWTTGQIFGHLAAWINFGYEGFPPGAHPPFFIRWFIKRKKAQYLRDGMRPGVRIPRSKDGTFGTEVMTTDEGASRLRAALMKLAKGEPARYHSPAFGAMPHDERIALQLRHAELHLSYLHP